MNALEREIMEKFHQLQPAAKQRIRALIEQETAETESFEFDYDGWFRTIETLRQYIRTSQSDMMASVDVVGMLRDIRDGEDE